jgi:hypothetical protein
MTIKNQFNLFSGKPDEDLLDFSQRLYCRIISIRVSNEPLLHVHVNLIEAVLSYPHVGVSVAMNVI